ncbi:MAG: RagB/SusD family nutrient uptake outer membrane protein [Bacteroidaceae bacterium]|nr:RagB/SusD family nutrient uptake outer membrane protein [Bacteroidaceae bacterium]
MKILNIKTYLPAIFAAVCMTSCMDDLKNGNIDPNVDAEPNLMGLYSKCYAGLIMEGNDGNPDFTIDDAGKSTLLRNVFNFNELCTDEAICWWSDGGITEMSYNNCLAGNASLKFLYYRLMSNIGYCNHFIELGQGGETMLAEVRVIRAYNYLLMLDFFGNPPFVDAIRTETPRQAHTYNSKYDASKNYTRAEILAMGREFMFGWVKGELEAAEPSLLAPAVKKDTDDDYGRIDKATAWLLLSRLHLNAGTYLNNDGQNNPNWQLAFDYAKKIIDSKTYKLFTDDQMSATAKNLGYHAYDLLFMGDNGSNGANCEALLPLLQDGKKTKGWGGSLFFIAAMWNGDMYSVNGKGAGTTGNNWSGMRCRPQLVGKFFANPTDVEGKTAAEVRALAGDDRALFWGKDHTVDLGDNDGFTCGIATPKWNNNYSNDGNPHDSYDVDTDFFLFRVAEAYLNAAEAAIHLNQTATAKDCLDAIRNRAHAAVKSVYTLDDVLDERSRELYFEGLRRTDLIRFNQFGGEQATYNWSYKGGNKSGVTFDKKFNVYPIPTSEMMANSNLVQNDGFNDIE